MFWNEHFLHFSKCYQALICSCTNSVGLLALRDSSQQQQEVAAGTTRPRRATGEEEKQKLSREICITILAHAEKRFSFSDRLVCATLLQAEMFEQHCHTFPVEGLNATVRPFRMLNKENRTVAHLWESRIQGLLWCSGTVPGSAEIQPPGDIFLDCGSVEHSHYHSHDNGWSRAVFLNKKTKQNQDVPVQCIEPGMPECTGHALHGEGATVVRNMPDFNERVIDHSAALTEMGKISIQIMLCGDTLILSLCVSLCHTQLPLACC